MFIEKHEWWTTPVWERHTEFDKEFNSTLIKETMSINPSQHGVEFNIWDLDTPNITILKTKIFDTAKELTETWFNSDYEFTPKILRGWISRQKPQELLPLHDHGNVVIAAVYYISTPENCGDLLLVDPRSASNWNRETDKGIDGVRYKRITPKEGKLVLFPGYVSHMVEPNRSNQIRISLATNIVKKIS
jgi:hypothetical protein